MSSKFSGRDELDPEGNLTRVKGKRAENGRKFTYSSPLSAEYSCKVERQQRGWSTTRGGPEEREIDRERERERERGE